MNDEVLRGMLGDPGAVLGCDVVLAAADAEFGLPEIDRGRWPFMSARCSAGTSAPRRPWS